MKHTLLIIAASIALASCGKLHHTAVTDISKVKESGSTDVTESITTTEKVDTVVVLKADTAESTVVIAPRPDTTYQVIDNDRLNVEIKYDPISGKLRTKAVLKEQLVPVKVDRTKVEHRKIETDYKSVEKTKHHEEQTTKTNPLVPWWVWFIILLVAFGYVVFRYVVGRFP